MVSKITSVLCLLALASTASAYSSGAPEDACGDMVPQHGKPAQKSAAPYTITANAKSFKSGEPVQVTIKGNSRSDTIKGFLMQARADGKPVGQFKLASDDKFAQLRNCGAPGNAITHQKHDSKEDRSTITATWIPPAGFKGQIKFRSTIALNGGVFWVGVESAPITIA